MMSDIKAIETQYNGYKFRSRTEARWAVFFDSLGLEYAYEKEGFDLGETGYYLPDFYIPKLDCYIEIKASNYSRSDAAKIYALAKHLNRVVFLFFDCAPFMMIRDGDDFQFRNGGYYFAPDGDSDGIMDFGVCQVCNEICIGHHGGHSACCALEYDYKGNCPGSISRGLHPKLERAYIAARSARFEYGESAKGIFS